MNTSEISNLFDFQLKVLNNLIESTIIKFNHYNLYSLNKGELSSVPLYKTYTFYADTCTEFNHGAIFLDYFKGLEINENATLDKKNSSILTNITRIIKFFQINIQYYF